MQIAIDEQVDSLNCLSQPQQLLKTAYRFLLIAQKMEADSASLVSLLINCNLRGFKISNADSSGTAKQI